MKITKSTVNYPKSQTYRLILSASEKEKIPKDEQAMKFITSALTKFYKARYA